MDKTAQMKIQEMAFVLLAIMIFFSMAVLLYFSVRMSSLQEEVQSLRESGARELARKLSDIPEFSWAECEGCVDADKILALKTSELSRMYRNFWDVEYLMVEKVYPQKPDAECTLANYPECSRITIISNQTGDYGSVTSASVALCGYEPSNGGYMKCELGKIHVAAKSIKSE